MTTQITAAQETLDNEQSSRKRSVKLFGISESEGENRLPIQTVRSVRRG